MPDTLEDMRTELARQDGELEAFSSTLQQLDFIDVPATFLADLDAACMVASIPSTPAALPLGLRV